MGASLFAPPARIKSNPLPLLQGVSVWREQGSSLLVREKALVVILEATRWIICRDQVALPRPAYESLPSISGVQSSTQLRRGVPMFPYASAPKEPGWPCQAHDTICLSSTGLEGSLHQGQSG